jgi:5-methylcytosine-specific restriction endonuclease McrA
MINEQTSECPNCGRSIELTKHHLIPKVKGGENSDSNYIWLCGDCHSQVHLLYDNNHLKLVLNTKDLLLADENLKKFGKFASKQTSNIKKKQSNSKKKKRK